MQLCRPLLSSVLLVAVVHLTHCTGELCEYLECISPFVATLDVVASNHVASNCVVNLELCSNLPLTITLPLHSSLHPFCYTHHYTPFVTLIITLFC